jgi:hypothetical protein
MAAKLTVVPVRKPLHPTALLSQSPSTLYVPHHNDPHDETPHHILELARAPRRRFKRSLLQLPLTTLGRSRAKASFWLG